MEINLSLISPYSTTQNLYKHLNRDSISFALDYIKSWWIQSHCVFRKLNFLTLHFITGKLIFQCLEIIIVLFFVLFKIESDSDYAINIHSSISLFEERLLSHFEGKIKCKSRGFVKLDLTIRCCAAYIRSCKNGYSSSSWTQFNILSSFYRWNHLSFKRYTYQRINIRQK